MPLPRLQTMAGAQLSLLYVIAWDAHVGVRTVRQYQAGDSSAFDNRILLQPRVGEYLLQLNTLLRPENAGLGLPSYYEWRTRSGCYFCFFQRKSEWVGLADRHPDLFEKAVALEQKVGHEATQMKGRAYTWSQGESLPELLDVLGDDDGDTACLVCDL